MLRRALRLMWGTAALAAGGWVLRALNGAPAALGAVWHAQNLRATPAPPRPAPTPGLVAFS